MKKSFINPAVRVIKFESKGMICDLSVDPGSQNQEDIPAPARAHIFGDSEF